MLYEKSVPERKTKFVQDFELSGLTDEDYLLFRAKEAQNISTTVSKCWLITALSLFPNNFQIQFQVYQLEKNARNVKEAARCLAELIQKFPEETLRYNEIDVMMRAVQSTSSLFDETESVSSSSANSPPLPSHEATFLTEIFYALPKAIQHKLVLTAAEHCSDTMRHCSLLLLFTLHFPETSHLQAPNLVDTLLSAEKLNPSPLNPYRKKLVCSVLPVLVGGTKGSVGLPISPMLLHQLLLLAVEYYTALLFSNKPPNNKVVGSGSTCTDVSLSGSSRTTMLSSAAALAWKSMLTCVQQIGTKLGWTLTTQLSSDFNREVALQRVLPHIKNLQMSMVTDNEDCVLELTYILTMLFLNALHEYTVNLAKDNSGGSTVGLTLVEAFTAPASPSSGCGSRSSSVCSDDLDVLSPPRPKRHRTSLDSDSLIPVITIGQGEGVCGSGLPQALTTAIKCWDLLHSHSRINSEFNRLLERLPLSVRLLQFNLDMLVHDARLTEASHELRALLEHVRAAESETVDLSATSTRPKFVPAIPFTHLEICLKLASVNYALNNLSGAAEACLEALPLFPLPSSTAPQISAVACSAGSALTLTGGAERHLHLLPLSRAHCLQFIVTLLISALRTRVIKNKFHDDLSIGHLIVLIQLDWPAYETAFQEVVGVLQKLGGLSYEPFSRYVTTPAIIEELVYLHSRDGGALHLDIAPVAPMLPKQQRTVSTRGPERSSKHDFKMAMRKQMFRCHESVAQNILTFLNKEGSSIHQVLV